jgi:hypothetical protein
MIRRWHIALFVAALGVFGVALAPASLLFGRLLAGVAAEGVAGTVWNGRAESGRIGAYHAHDISWRLSARALFTGRIAMALRSQGGALRGAGKAVLGPGAARRFEVAEAQIAGLDLSPALALAGETQISGLVLEFREGRCVRAEGVVRSNVLSQSAARLGWQGPPLEGGARCEGAGAVIEAVGASGAEDVRVAITVSPSAPGAWRIDVRSASPQTSAALAAAGFRVDPAGGGAILEGEFSWRAP